jgi:hypothetical protein
MEEKVCEDWRRWTRESRKGMGRTVAKRIVEAILVTIHESEFGEVLWEVERFERGE